MSQPTNRNLDFAREFGKKFLLSDDGGKLLMELFAQARTEAAEAMREAAKQAALDCECAAINPSWEATQKAIAEEIASLPTPEGDTTPTERGEESGDLLAECSRVLYDISMQATRHTRAATDYNLLLRDLEFIEDKTRALLARLPKGKETPTP